MLLILCLSLHGLFTCFTLSKACHTLLILCLSFHGLFTCFTLSKACHTLLILCLSFPTCFTCFSCCFAHIIALSALYRSLCCAFAGNTCPHGQANLRACSVASHCGHTFRQRNPPRGLLPSSRELPVNARALNINARAKYIKWRICSAASSTRTLTSPKSDYTKNAKFKH